MYDLKNNASYLYDLQIQNGAVITRSIFFKILKIDTHSSPSRPKYGMAIARLKFG